MPLPTEDTLPPNAPAGPSTSHTATPDTEEILKKFEQLGKDARAEEGEEDEDDAEDGEAEESGAGEVQASGSGVVGGEGGKKKKKKKKGKAGKAVQRLKDLASGQAPQELVDSIRSDMDPGESNATDEEIRKALKAVDLMKILDGQVALGNKSNTKIIGEHKFWKTQPVPQHLSGPAAASTAIEEGPIDPIKTPQEVRQEPLALPSGFEWSIVDIKDDVQCEEVYSLLSENYVEDDNATMRFKYSKEFLLWALTAPGYHPEWHIGVRVQKTGKLVAFISGILVEIRVRSKIMPSAEINFLCVHKKLRAKRLTPVLIKEVTRRVNLRDVWQAIYTAGIVLPTPVGTCRYFHRNLNPPKLHDIGFSGPLSGGETISRRVRLLSVPPTPKLPGFREMQADDIKPVAALLRRYLERFDIAQTFASDEEVEHWFLSGRGKEGEEEGKREGQVVWAYVVEDPTTHTITDLISFYSLPSSIIGHATYDVLNAAYMFYYASDTVFPPNSSAESSSGDGGVEERRGKERLRGRLNALVGDLLVVAKNAGFDVLNALTMLDNNVFLQEQKFGAGDGFLNYYLYNWQCAPVDGGMRGTGLRQSSGIGMVML